MALHWASQAYARGPNAHLDGRVDELVDKLGLQVLEEELGRADLERLGARGLKVLLLTDIGH